MLSEKMDSINKALKEIDSVYGTGKVIKLPQNATLKKISTGVTAIDDLIGGGIPGGRIIEIFGPPASCKTTLALQIIKQVQEEGEIAAFIDVENALDPEYVRDLGVKVEDMYMVKATNAEQALFMCARLIESNSLGVIVLDSIAALVPQAELEGEIGDPLLGTQAYIVSEGVKRIIAALNNSKTIAIFINQIRTNIKSNDPKNMEYTPGGYALKFYSTIRLRLGFAEKLDDGVIRLKAYVVKSKVSPSFKGCDLFFKYGQGFLQ